LAPVERPLLLDDEDCGDEVEDEEKEEVLEADVLVKDVPLADEDGLLVREVVEDCVDEVGAEDIEVVVVDEMLVVVEEGVELVGVAVVDYCC
jgi:hypothetical protein